MARIYLDYNATAPLRPEARTAMIAAMDEVGNPSSVHQEGRAAKMIMERAREQVAVAGMTRFLMNFLPPEKQPVETIAFNQGRLKSTYQILDAHLAGRDWIVGDDVTIADMTCCGYLYYPEPFGFDRADWPNIDAWLTRLSQQPGWKAPYDLMPGNPSERA